MDNENSVINIEETEKKEVSKIETEKTDLPTFSYDIEKTIDSTSKEGKAININSPYKIINEIK